MDLAKVVPESYQTSNEFSVNRKNGQNIATDDKTRNDKDAMLDCEGAGKWLSSGQYKTQAADYGLRTTDWV